MWFDCIPPAPVAANCPQRDSVVLHKVMKTHKVLITCQWQWSATLVDLYALSLSFINTHTVERRNMFSHNVYIDMHTAADTDAQACTMQQLYYTAVIRLWLMVPSLVVFIMSSYWRGNFSLAMLGCVGKLIWSNTWAASHSCRLQPLCSCSDICILVLLYILLPFVEGTFDYVEFKDLNELLIF